MKNNIQRKERIEGWLMYFGIRFRNLYFIHQKHSFIAFENILSACHNYKVVLIK